MSKDKYLNSTPKQTLGCYSEEVIEEILDLYLQKSIDNTYKFYFDNDQMVSISYREVCFYKKELAYRYGNLPASMNFNKDGKCISRSYSSEEGKLHNLTGTALVDGKKEAYYIHGRKFEKDAFNREIKKRRNKYIKLAKASSAENTMGEFTDEIGEEIKDLFYCDSSADHEYLEFVFDDAITISIEEGDLFFYKGDKYHRDGDYPAIFTNDYYQFCKKGVASRLNGPGQSNFIYNKVNNFLPIHSDEYLINGKEYTREEFDDKIKMIKNTKPKSKTNKKVKMTKYLNSTKEKTLGPYNSDILYEIMDLYLEEAEKKQSSMDFYFDDDTLISIRDRKTFVYYKNKLNNWNNPALFELFGRKMYYQDGKLHNTMGYAIIDTKNSSNNQYWIDGKQIKEENFKSESLAYEMRQKKKEAQQKLLELGNHVDDFSKQYSSYQDQFKNAVGDKEYIDPSKKDSDKIEALPKLLLNNSSVNFRIISKPYSYNNSSNRSAMQNHFMSAVFDHKSKSIKKIVYDASLQAKFNAFNARIGSDFSVFDRNYGLSDSHIWEVSINNVKVLEKKYLDMIDHFEAPPVKIKETAQTKDEEYYTSEFIKALSGSMIDHDLKEVDELNTDNEVQIFLEDKELIQKINSLEVVSCEDKFRKFRILTLPYKVSLTKEETTYKIAIFDFETNSIKAIEFKDAVFDTIQALKNNPNWGDVFFFDIGLHDRSHKSKRLDFGVSPFAKSNLAPEHMEIVSNWFNHSYLKKENCPQMENAELQVLTNDLLAYFDDKGYSVHYKNGIIHRENGPAVYDNDSAKNSNEYTLNGASYVLPEFLNKLKEQYAISEVLKGKTNIVHPFYETDQRNLLLTGKTFSDFTITSGCYQYNNKSVFKSEGYVAFFDIKSGLLNREGNLPAVMCQNGDKFYYQNGEMHRTDGAALELRNGYHEYWVDGIKMTKEEFELQYTNTTVEKPVEKVIDQSNCKQHEKLFEQAKKDNGILNKKQDDKKYITCRNINIYEKNGKTFYSKIHRGEEFSWDTSEISIEGFIKQFDEYKAMIESDPKIQEAIDTGADREVILENISIISQLGELRFRSQHDGFTSDIKVSDHTLEEFIEIVQSTDKFLAEEKQQKEKENTLVKKCVTANKAAFKRNVAKEVFNVAHKAIVAGIKKSGKTDYIEFIDTDIFKNILKAILGHTLPTIEQFKSNKIIQEAAFEFQVQTIEYAQSEVITKLQDVIKDQIINAFNSNDLRVDEITSILEDEDVMEGLEEEEPEEIEINKLIF